MAARILIIEDNPTNMELMAYLVTAFGYEVQIASDGTTGVDLAIQEPPDLVICDIEMPGLNGFDVVRALRERSETRSLPMVAVTAYAMVGDRERMLAAGFDGYLSKPIDPQTFMNEVAAYLPEKKRSTSQPETHEAITHNEPTPHAGNPLILVVDDSPVNLALIKSTLEPCGYRVVTADTVDAGLKLTRHYAFDLILSDLHMAPDTGLDFLTLVRATETLSAIPFLLCTSSRTDPNDGLEQQAMKLGADVFFSRPIVPELLLQHVAAGLKSRGEMSAKK
jgi:two-component system cell cycle response regulator